VQVVGPYLQYKNVCYSLQSAHTPNSTVHVPRTYRYTHVYITEMRSMFNGIPVILELLSEDSNI